MDRHQSVLVVVGARELELHLELVELCLEAAHEVGGFLGALTLGEQLAPGDDLVGVFAQPFERLDTALEAAPLLHQWCALGAIVPKARLLHRAIDLGQALVQVRLLKDTP